MTTTFTIEHDKFYQLLFFTAHYFHKLLVKNYVLNFKINLNYITFHTHTHTQTSDKIFKLLKVPQM